MATRTTRLTIYELQRAIIDLIASAKNSEPGDGIGGRPILLSMLVEKLKEQGIEFHDNQEELTVHLNLLLSRGFIKIESFCYDDINNQHTVWIKVVNDYAFL